MNHGETIRPGRPSLTAIDVEFEPMYALTYREHEVLINTLFNLVVDLVHQSGDPACPRTGKEIAERAAQIFSDYDEDLSEALLQFAATAPTGDS